MGAIQSKKTDVSAMYCPECGQMPHKGPCIKPEDKWPCSVKILNGQVITVNTKAGSTVLDIKNEIASKGNVDASKINLVFNGKELIDTNTIMQFNPASNEIITVTLKPQPHTN